MASLRASTSPIIGAHGRGGNKGATGGATGGSSSLPGSVGPGNLLGGGLWVIGLGDPVGVVVGVVPTLLLRGSISLEGDSDGVWPGEAGVWNDQDKVLPTSMGSESMSTGKYPVFGSNRGCSGLPLARVTSVYWELTEVEKFFGSGCSGAWKDWIFLLWALESNLVLFLNRF